MPFAALPAPPEPSDWLRRCEGFDVQGPHGRIGRVEEARFPRVGAPDALAVRPYEPGAPIVILSVEDVTQVYPAARRLHVRAA